jgi:hypothetical protein
MRISVFRQTTHCGLVAPPASAASQNLGGILGKLWTKVLELPTPDNPFASGDPCVELRGNIVAPLSSKGVATCTVKHGTKILFSGWTTECSTFEGNGTTEAELRKCAQDADAEISPSVTFNGVPIQLSSVGTELVRTSLPEDNIIKFSYPDREFDLTGLSVAHGYEYLTKPLKRGTLTIVNNVTFGDGSTQKITTVIIVE